LRRYDVVMPIMIRAVTATDATTLVSLNADVQAIHAQALPWRFKPPGAYTRADAEALLARPNYVALLAELDGEPAGYLVAEVVRHPETGRHHAHAMIYVHELSVREAFRRRGVASALMDAAKAHGETLGITRLALDTWSFNEGALAFFKAYGLTPYNVKLWNKS
jgi:ribosomal protein S18 acetylase RimI-like enzyme